MASFFKGSCVVYWLCWLGCLAYFFGTYIYTDTYMMRTKDMDQVGGTVKFLCFFNVFMAFFGCVFVKCSITHVLCAALYILPIIGVNAAFCIMGVIQVRGLSPPTPQELLKDVQKSLKKSRYPEWLINVQKQLPCCGVYSFLDFPLIFNINKTGRGRDGDPDHQNLSMVIPRTCCKSTVATRRCNLGLDDLSTSLNESLTVTEMWEKINSSQNCVDFTQNSPYLKDYPKIRFTPAANISDGIFLCGCHSEVNRLASSLHQSHFIFFLVLLGAALIMAFVYVKVWCKHRGSNVDSGSDHSLEVDEMSSVHSIKPDEAPITDYSGSHIDLLGKQSSTFRTRTGSIAESATTVGGSKLPKPKQTIINLRRVGSVLPIHPPKK